MCMIRGLWSFICKRIFDALKVKVGCSFPRVNIKINLASNKKLSRYVGNCNQPFLHAYDRVRSCKLTK